jgi:alkanesulfonate monooxygenase SsuD/methylene tetrahydromethanopterin reductase-like flavin-dependent oxidoreductase (luciferase family)
VSGQQAERTGVLVGTWPLGMPSDPVSFYARLPQLVEGAGFESLFVGDHLFAAGPGVEALTLAASFLAQTTDLAVGTGVLQLALREPAATAKQVATIDCLSGGRFVFGVGTGGEFVDEWAAVGTPWEGRGRRLDDQLALARRCGATSRCSIQARSPRSSAWWARRDPRDQAGHRYGWVDVRTPR